MNTMLALAVAGTKRQNESQISSFHSTQICCLLFLNFVTESQQTDHSPADALQQRASVATLNFWPNTSRDFTEFGKSNLGNALASQDILIVW